MSDAFEDMLNRHVWYGQAVEGMTAVQYYQFFDNMWLSRAMWCLAHNLEVAFAMEAVAQATERATEEMAADAFLIYAQRRGWVK